MHFCAQMHACGVAVWRCGGVAVWQCGSVAVWCLGLRTRKRAEKNSATISTRDECSSRSSQPGISRLSISTTPVLQRLGAYVLVMVRKGIRVGLRVTFEARIGLRGRLGLRPRFMAEIYG